MTDEQLMSTAANDVYHNVTIEKFADSKLPENMDKSRDQNVLPSTNTKCCNVHKCLILLI